MIQTNTLLPHEASEIFMAIALILSTVLVFNFTRKRVAEMPAEEKKIGRPLYMSGFSMLILGVASIMYIGHHLFESEVVGMPPILQIYWFLSILGAGILALSALEILGWQQYNAIPLSAIMIGSVFALLGNTLGIDVGPEPTAGANGLIVGIITLVLFALPMVLYGYLAYRTRTASVATIAFLAPVYAIWPVAMSWIDVYLAGTTMELVLTFVRLLGPAMVVVAYYIPDIKISGELLGYGAAYAAAGLWFSAFLSPYFLIGEAVLIADPMEMIFLASHGFIAAFGLATAAYIYNRYRLTRNLATLFLMLYFVIGSIDYLTHALEEHGTLLGLEGEYLTIIMSLMAPMFLNISALIALDWRRIMMLPGLIAMPGLIYIFTNFPVEPYTLALLNPIMIVTDGIQLTLPIIMYSLIWWRARKMAARGRSRALFIVLGIAGMLVTTVFLALLIPHGYLELVVIPYLFFWIGITGRADKLLQTDK